MVKSTPPRKEIYNREMSVASEAVEAVYRAEWGRIVAALISLIGDFDLAEECAQEALTLRTLCGLETDEIARAFLVPSTTMAQRLVRAKRKIRDAGIPYAVPETKDMAARIDPVLTVIYLVFNEGYAATKGGPLVR